MPYKVIYIMGVAGSGKTTIGNALSAKTGYNFFDADNFHPQKNIDKMSNGIPLTEGDRLPWLENIHAFAKEKIITQTILIACSALKEKYRNILSNGMEEQCCWVFLKGDYEIISQRMQARAGHFMKADMLQSQFDILEIPENAIEVDITKTTEIIIEEIISQLNLAALKAGS